MTVAMTLARQVPQPLALILSRQHGAHQSTPLSPFEMDAFELSDDDVFADPAFEEVFAQAVSLSKTPSRPPRQMAPLEELEPDDSLLDHESLSHAVAIASQHLTTAKSDKLETPHVIDYGLLDRPIAIKFKPWTNIPHVGEDEFGDADFEDPKVIAALGDAERHIIPPIVGPVQEPAREIIQITRAELEAIKRNAFLAGQTNYHRLWKRRYIFDILKLPAGMTSNSSY
jgi:hypothetical protein